MAAYTVVDQPLLEEFLQRFQIGSLVAFEEIPAGVVNSNYFVTTTENEYVLTLFEVLGVGEVPYYLSLMAYLSAAGLPCPRPIADSKGRHLAIFAGKPTALVEKLAGASVISATPKQCGELGTYTARLHVAAKHFPARQPNRYDLSWCERTAADLYPALAQDDAQLLRTELAAQRALDRGLVRSTIHADLFRDNVLFDAGALSGMIDFYYACDELLLYDLAIAFNDWCVDRSGDIDTKLASSLLTAYRQTRPVTDAEIRNWPLIVRLTCLRWWIFRLARKLSRDDSAIPTGKDPDEFRDLLRAHTERTDMLIALWH